MRDSRIVANNYYTLLENEPCPSGEFGDYLDYLAEENVCFGWDVEELTEILAVKLKRMGVKLRADAVKKLARMVYDEI